MKNLGKFMFTAKLPGGVDPPLIFFIYSFSEENLVGVNLTGGVDPHHIFFTKYGFSDKYAMSLTLVLASGGVFF